MDREESPAAYTVHSIL